MDCSMRHIQTKRFVFVIFDELYRVFRQQMRQIARFSKLFGAVPPVECFHSIKVRNVVDVPADEAAECFESVVYRIVLWIIAKVPFPEDGCAIAGSAQKFRKRDFTPLQSAMMIGNLWVCVDDAWNPSSLLTRP